MILLGSGLSKNSSRSNFTPRTNKSEGLGRNKRGPKTLINMCVPNGFRLPVDWDSRASRTASFTRLIAATRICGYSQFASRSARSCSRSWAGLFPSRRERARNAWWRAKGDGWALERATSTGIRVLMTSGKSSLLVSTRFWWRTRRRKAIASSWRRELGWSIVFKLGKNEGNILARGIDEDEISQVWTKRMTETREGEDANWLCVIPRSA